MLVFSPDMRVEELKRSLISDCYSIDILEGVTIISARYYAAIECFSSFTE